MSDIRCLRHSLANEIELHWVASHRSSSQDYQGPFESIDCTTMGFGFGSNDQTCRMNSDSRCWFICPRFAPWPVSRTSMARNGFFFGSCSFPPNCPSPKGKWICQSTAVPVEPPPPNFSGPLGSSRSLHSPHSCTRATCRLVSFPPSDGRPSWPLWPSEQSRPPRPPAPRDRLRRRDRASVPATDNQGLG